MAILTDGISSDGVEARVRIWDAGTFKGQVSGMNYLNPAACVIDEAQDRVNLTFPAGGAGQPHGSSHLTGGSDPIPPGVLRITGVEDDFEVPGRASFGELLQFASTTATIGLPHLKYDGTRFYFSEGLEVDGEALVDSLESGEASFSGNVAVAASLSLTGGNETYLLLPTMAEADRPPSPSAGMMIFNTTTNKFQGHDGTSWYTFASEEAGVPSHGGEHLSTGADPIPAGNLNITGVTGNFTVAGTLTSQGDVTFQASLSMEGGNTTFVRMPRMASANRPPSPSNGMMIFNTDESWFEGYDGTAWRVLGVRGEVAAHGGEHLSTGADPIPAGDLNVTGVTGAFTVQGVLTANANLLCQASLEMQGGANTYVRLPQMASAERPPTPQAGMMIFNTDEAWFEGYDGTSWEVFARAGEVASHGSSHLATGADPIPAGDLNVTGVTGAFTVQGVLTVNSNLLCQASLELQGGANTYARLPQMTAAERPPSPAAGMMIFNTEEAWFEGHDGTGWQLFAKAGQVASHGSSHLATGADPIPAGDLNVTGVTGNFTVAGTLTANGDLVCQENLRMEGGAQTYLHFPRMAEADRPPSPSAGMMIFNTTTNKFQGHDGTDWFTFASEEAGVATHGSSHLATGGDPIPAGDLNITGVTGDFEVDGVLSVQGNATLQSSLSLTGGGGTYIRVPQMVEADRPDPPAEGMLIYNTDRDRFQGHDGTDWFTLAVEEAGVATHGSSHLSGAADPIPAGDLDITGVTGDFEVDGNIHARNLIQFSPTSAETGEPFIRFDNVLYAFYFSRATQISGGLMARYLVAENWLEVRAEDGGTSRFFGDVEFERVVTTNDKLLVRDGLEIATLTGNYLRLANLTEAMKPDPPALGMMIYNTDADVFEGYDGEWFSFGKKIHGEEHLSGGEDPIPAGTLNITGVTGDFNVPDYLTADALRVVADARISQLRVDEEIWAYGTLEMLGGAGTFLRVPRMTTGNRPDPAQEGMIIFNTDTKQFEGYNGTYWVILG